MKKVILVFNIPILTPLLVPLLDFFLRKIDGNIHTGGIPDVLFTVILYLVPALTAVIICFALWKKSPLLAILLSGSGAFATFWYLAWVFLMYVCNAGIDCL